MLITYTSFQSDLPGQSLSRQLVWLVLSVFYLVKLVVRFTYNKTNSQEMAFFSDQFWRGVLFFAVGGVSSVAILKIWENRDSVLREIRKRFDTNETRQPEEHDERFDWEGKSSVSYENILSKSDRLMVISEKLCDACKPWLFRQRRGNPFLRANSPSWSSWVDVIFIIIFLFFLFTLKKLVIFPIVVRATYSAGTETKRQKMRSNIILSNQHLTM